MQSLISNKVLDVCVLLFSIVAFFSSIKWIGNVFFGLYDFFNLFLLLFILFLIGTKLQWKVNLKHVTPSFHFKTIPFIIVLFSIALWLIATFVLDINILAAIAFSMYVFGLFGLYTNTKSWINSIVPFSLILMTLPFGNIMDLYIGFPLRLIAVDSIASMFNGLGFHNVTSSTIITIENSATQIDFSCSGLKGIWSALIFYFSITWLENLKIGFNWLITFILLIIAILSTNIIRIFIIVSLNAVFNLPELAEIIHAPLGVIGFIFSCLFIYYCVKSNIYQKEWIKINFVPPNSNRFITTSTKIHHATLNWTKGLIILLLISTLFISKKESVNSNKFISLNFPSEWVVTPLDLSKNESNFIKEQGSSISKTSFQTKNISGSLLLIHCNGWRGHHNPEYCIRAGGHRIDHLETIKINEKLPIKWMKVNGTSFACYWFQSPTKSTDDFGTRVWSEVRNEEKNWVLVSVVFKDHQDLEETGIIAFVNDLGSVIDKYLTTQI